MCSQIILYENNYNIIIQFIKSQCDKEMELDYSLSI